MSPEAGSPFAAPDREPTATEDAVGARLRGQLLAAYAALWLAGRAGGDPVKTEPPRA